MLHVAIKRQTHIADDHWQVQGICHLSEYHFAVIHAALKQTQQADHDFALQKNVYEHKVNFVMYCATPSINTLSSSISELGQLL